MLLISLIISFLLTGTLAKRFSKATDAVLLSKVRALTLHADKETSHRRVKAIPQLTCVGGNACNLYDVDVIRCTNSGSEYDAEDIQWTCKASLPPEFKLGGTEVVCEGYDGPDDPSILKGSCGVEYRLILTKAGEKKYGGKVFDKPSTYAGLFNTQTKGKEEGRDWGSTLFWIVFVLVVGIILYRILTGAQGGNFNPPRAGFGRPGGGGGGGGGGGYGNDDPPPPYTPRNPPQPKRKPQTPRSSNSRGQGFWGGSAAGAAAGYGAGYYMGSRNRGGSSWLGGGGGGGGPSSSGSGGSGSSSSSAPSPSSSRYESAGFGGTRRR